MALGRVDLFFGVADQVVGPGPGADAVNSETRRLQSQVGIWS